MKRAFFYRKHYLLLCLLLCLNLPSAFGLELDNTTKLYGYYKNFFVTSKATSTEENFFLDTERFRIELNKNFSASLSTHLAYDNEIIINDLSGNPDFNTIREKEQKELAFWDSDKTISDSSHLFWKHSLYRAYIKYSVSSLRFTAGKQGIDWSRMRFYFPFDLFNPISPLDIEKDEKIGVDALNLEFYPQSFSLINFIYAPHKNTDNAKLGLKLSKKVSDYDISLILGEIKKDEVVGLGFDGYLFEAGLRGELTYTKKDNQKGFLRLCLGLDHNFTPRLYALTEYFYNGGAEKDTTQFLNSYQFSRQALSIRKHIVGSGIEYELSGITKLANYLFYDFEGKSLFYNPELKCNIITDLDLAAGAQLFTGDDKSEFGNYNRLFYFQLKKYF